MRFGKVRLYDKASGVIIIVNEEDHTDQVTSLDHSAYAVMVEGEAQLRRLISNGPTLRPPEPGENVVYCVNHQGLCLWGFRSRYDSLLSSAAA